jgi:hypothetical protein
MADFPRSTRDRNLDDFRGHRPFSAGIRGPCRECRDGPFPSAFPPRKSGRNALCSLENRGCHHFDRLGCGIDHICPMGSGPELKIEGARRYLDVKIFFSTPYIHEGDNTWLALARFQ